MIQSCGFELAWLNFSVDMCKSGDFPELSFIRRAWISFEQKDGGCV